jgi:hypothetical protein
VFEPEYTSIDLNQGAQLGYVAQTPGRMLIVTTRLTLQMVNPEK